MSIIVNELSKRYLKQGIIKEEDTQVFIFGMKQALKNSINVLSIVLVGVFVGEILGLITFSSVYLLLRSYAGGYHAKTELGCYFFSVSLVVIVGLVLKYNPLNYNLLVIGVLCSILILLKLVPVENDKKQLEEIEIEHYRTKFYKLLAGVTLVLCLSLFVFLDLSIILGLAIITTAFIVSLGYLFRK